MIWSYGASSREADSFMNAHGAVRKLSNGTSTGEPWPTIISHGHSKITRWNSTGYQYWLVVTGT